ncbi:RxLR effector protein [Phytophthora megakarya]|uniref:RxLR effector protein n=1 Tax=Phytophthora megakarya TaxID=4795 RepID=A0A225W711_9STRA|nr:RxLR effector protein [Phytophthora megakarya]
MHFRYLLLIAAAAFLANHDAVCAGQATAASVETATQLNSVDAEKMKRFLRSHKRVDDDTVAETEERGQLQNMFFSSWLSAGKSPGQANQLIQQFTISADKKAKLLKKYTAKYQGMYSTFK